MSAVVPVTAKVRVVSLSGRLADVVGPAGHVGWARRTPSGWEAHLGGRLAGGGRLLSRGHRNRKDAAAAIVAACERQAVAR